MNEEAFQHFRKVSMEAFQFLVDDFGFHEAPLPPGEFVNRFQFLLSNGSLTLIVEGISYGSGAIVSLTDKFGRKVGINCLLPDWTFFGKRKKSKKKNILTQDQQIIHAAQVLKENGQDILKGDLTRFNKIGDHIKEIMVRLHGPYRPIA